MRFIPHSTWDKKNPIILNWSMVQKQAATTSLTLAPTCRTTHGAGEGARRLWGRATQRDCTNGVEHGAVDRGAWQRDCMLQPRAVQGRLQRSRGAAAAPTLAQTPT